MSKYEDYDSVSRCYDNQRVAMGADVMAAMIQFHSGKQLQDLHILDAGCGTGNYAKAFIEYGVGNMTLLDASSGMLEKAKVKLADAIGAGKIKSVVEATMPPMPFPDASFDAVMFNLVLHHLESNPDGENYPTVLKVLTEARRVLKADGVVAIAAGAPLRVYDTVWYVHLNKDTSKRHAKQYPRDKQWNELFQGSDFHMISNIDVNMALPDSVQKLYADPEGPLKKEWRDGNSYWASATEEELKLTLDRVKDMKENGTLEQFVKDHDTTNGMFPVTTLFGKPM